MPPFTTQGAAVSERVCKSYKVLVGLEIHVQLATASKMFTAAANAFGGEPNTRVDEQVLGLPGTLPVMNKKAVEYSIKAGLALGCKIAKHTKWDRKSYYYPDLPKNYQISQYDLPLCYEGTFEGIRIRRAHLEEDAGKLLHEAPGGFRIDHSIVDLNRAGTPLLEIVTEPDFTTAQQVAAFAQELQKVVQFLGVSEAQMQLGHMRFEPNINVHITDAAGNVHKTAITEIKNLNSFSVLERATDYEINRQIRQWEETGDLGKKSTYGWDEATESTFHQRDKEDANDYRYFPDPDLVPVEVNDEWLAELKSQVGELPGARRKRYAEVLGLSPADAATLAGDRATGDILEGIIAVKIFGPIDPKRAANLLLSHGRRISNESGKPLAEIGIWPIQYAQVASLIDGGKLAASAAGLLFDRIANDDVPPGIYQTFESSAAGTHSIEGPNLEALADSMGLTQVNDAGAIDAAIDSLITENSKSLQDYRAGKQAALGALMGMVMKAGKGLNPKLVQERLKARLS
jgi:aspartyl-tRNA(Asn)/glutamyl-tRNA(Gln) amidotransferase subunit B